MKGMQLRYLSDEMVRELLSVQEAMVIIEDAYRYYGTGDAFLSKPSSLDLRTINTGTSFKVKGAHVASSHIAGFRLVGIGSSYPISFCYLCDPETSLPVAIVNESWQYVIRSGLTAAVTAKYLANQESRILGLLGCGRIAPFTLMGLKKYFPLSQVRVNSQRKESRQRFAEEMEKALELEIIPADSPQEAVMDADIVVTLTNANQPLICSKWLKDGVFVCSLGDGQELHHDVLDWADKLIVDDFDFCLILGDVSAWVKKGLKKEEEIRRKVWADIGEVVAGKKSGRESESENILGIMQGIASCDVALSKFVLDKAIQKGAGTIWNL